MARGFWNDNDVFAWSRQTPREVKGGIKAHSKRGDFAKKWWSKRWIQTLESFHIGARLSRGRSYARKGQVAALDISKGKVTAKVQGTRSGAYRIAIKLKPFTKKDWEQIIERIAEQPIYAVQLLANEMPQDIEAVFEELELSLFPEQQKDLNTDCSCPDWSNPCKHIAAVFYLMAEAFDEDPFLLFRLRGMDRETFLGKLRKNQPAEAMEVAPSAPKPSPLPTEYQQFWNQGMELPQPPAPQPMTVHAALPKKLGNIPFWRADMGYVEAMENIYSTVAEAMDAKYMNNMDEGV